MVTLVHKTWLVSKLLALVVTASSLCFHNDLSPQAETVTAKPISWLIQGHLRFDVGYVILI